MSAAPAPTVDDFIQRWSKASGSELANAQTFVIELCAALALAPPANLADATCWEATAEARVLKWGKSTCFIEAELFDPEGELVAKASATQAPKPFKRF